MDPATKESEVGGMVEQLKTRLEKAQLRPSYQRLRILEYLAAGDRHPSADQVYRDLRDSVPTLSKATVYNTLHAFVDKGLVRAFTTSGDEARYDVVTDEHGHFICTVCQRIYDFQHEFKPYQPHLDGFRVDAEEIVLKGICKQCLSDRQEDQHVRNK